MKENQIQMMGFAVSERCRTYSYQVIDPSGGTRQFTVDVSLDLFRTSPLKFQDGPLISRERLLQALAGETPSAPVNAKLKVSEPDIHDYMERHYPPKARTWNHYVPASTAGK